MNTVTKDLQTDLKALITSLKQIKIEATDLHKYYFSSGANALVDALASGATAATVTSKLNKGELINGITLCGELVDFFGNAAVSQSDYLSSAHNMLNGSDVAGAALSNDVENIGDRLKSLAGTLVAQFKVAKEILAVYTGNQVDLAIANLDANRVIFGADMTKTELSAGITLVEQFKKMINNEVVSTGDYASTLNLWHRL